MSSSKKNMSTKTEFSVRQALQNAHRQHQSGNLHEAVAGYRQALSQYPRQINVLRLLGVAEAQLGNMDVAREIFESATKQSPKDAESHYNLGRLLLEMSQHEEAKTSLERALSLRSNHGDTRLNLGLCLKELGDRGGAEREFQRALDLNKNHSVVLNNLGALLLERGETEKAIELFNSAIRCAPRYAQAHFNLGKAHHSLGKLGVAEASYRTAMEVEPKFAEPLVALANLKVDNGAYEDALALNEQALRLSLPPFHAAKIRYNVARIYRRLMRPQDGLAVLDQVLKALPKDLDARIFSAKLQTDLGRIQEAEETLFEVLSDSPGHSMASLALAELGTFARRHTGSEDLISAMRGKLEAQTSDREEQAQLHFALARALHDTGDITAAFTYLRMGNDLKYQSIPYNAEADARTCAASVERYGVLKDRPITKESTPIPIFVVGMPRSGTTLVEQILAAHPDVASCGELNFIEALRRRAETVTDDNPDGYLAIGTAYLERIEQRFSPQTRYITDKTPRNFSQIGWMRQALPAAKFVNCQRAPMDTAFACYQCLFHDSLPWTYDFDALASYYRNYERVMAGWREAFPGEILDISYEKMVAEPEQIARDLLAFCGLQWDERCLSFYKNSNPVITASNAQVRRPIYRSSVGKWLKYEEFLEPLMRAMTREDI